MLISLHMATMFWSRTRPNGSGSSSKVKYVVPHSLNSVGRTSAGWPLITKRREFSFRRLASRSSRDCSKNLKVFILRIVVHNPSSIVMRFDSSSIHLHLFVPTLEDPANQGSRMKIQRNVSHLLIPRNKAGLSLSLSPFLNQCTVCFFLELFLMSFFILTFLWYWELLLSVKRDCQEVTQVVLCNLLSPSSQVLPPSHWPNKVTRSPYSSHCPLHAMVPFRRVISLLFLFCECFTISIILIPQLPRIHLQWREIYFIIFV